MTYVCWSQSKNVGLFHNLWKSPGVSEIEEVIFVNILSDQKWILHNVSLCEVVVVKKGTERDREKHGGDRWYFVARVGTNSAPVSSLLVYVGGHSWVWNLCPEKCKYDSIAPNIDPMFVHIFIHKKGTLDLYHCLFQSALISWWVLTWIDYRNPFICYFVFFYETACAIWLRIILTLQERPFIWFQGWFPVMAQISQILETGNR